MKRAETSWTVFLQVQPGRRSEVRRDRARDGDRLTRTSTSCGSMTQRPYTQTQTHLHFRKSWRLVKMLESFRKTGNIWSWILMLFFLFFATLGFKKTKKNLFVSVFIFLLVIFTVNKSSSSVEAWVSDSFKKKKKKNLPSPEAPNWNKCFYGERRRTHDSLQGPKILHQPLSHNTTRTLDFVPCATRGSAVMLCVFVFFIQCELNQPHTPQSARSVCLSVKRGVHKAESKQISHTQVCFSYFRVTPSAQLKGFIS